MSGPTHPDSLPPSPARPTLPNTPTPSHPAPPQAGDWAHSVTLMRWLRALGVSDFGIFPELGTALCALAAAELAPLYKAMYPQGYRGPAGAFPKVG